MRPFRLCSLVMLSALFVWNSSARLYPQQAQRLDSIDLDHAHVMLRQAYEDVSKNYFDPKYRGLDLKATYLQYDAKLNSARSVGESYRIIAAFLDKLHDSHTFLLPPARSNRSTMGLHMEMVGDKCFVTRIRPGTDAATKLHVGDQVLALNGYNVNHEDFRNLQYFLAVLAPAQMEKLDLANPAGQQRQETINALIRPGKAVLDVSGARDDSDIWKLVREDEEENNLNRERLHETEDTLFWKMPEFFITPDVVSSVFSKARKHKTLVLDLRGNPGGAVDTLKDVLGYVFDHDVKIGDLVSRKNSKPEIAKSRGGAVFNGKLIVLVDSNSGSSAEIFARVVQLEHRGQVIGDRSAGAVMEALHYRESLGADTRIFYGFSVTIANLIMTDGKSLENTGVTPDEIVLPTAADLAEGKDPALSRAAELAGTTLDPAAAGKLFPFEWRSP
ncbi:MAG TPA: S41 family peptidase [Edaphobacter sp.]|nr:S41 family peptidase [Edaphobacter sp.]